MSKVKYIYLYSKVSNHESKGRRRACLLLLKAKQRIPPSKQGKYQLLWLDCKSTWPLYTLKWYSLESMMQALFDYQSSSQIWSSLTLFLQIKRENGSDDISEKSRVSKRKEMVQGGISEESKI